jgi:hypothetical protein
MSYSSTMQVLSVPKPAMPRGARLAAAIYGGISSLLRPAPRMLTRSEEAASVRELARSVQDSDPGFAADLLAAATRHESLDDEDQARRPGTMH